MSKIFKYLAPFIAIGFILFSSYFYDEVPYLKESILGLWILITIYFYFIKVPNLQEKSLYLTTQNDHGAMYGNLILGLFMIVGGSFYYYYTQVFHLFLWLLMFQSALLIFLNFYKKTETKGLSFKIKDEQLEYFIGKEHKKMTLQEIEHVHIQKDEIIISQGEQKKKLSFVFRIKSRRNERNSFFFQKHSQSKSSDRRKLNLQTYIPLSKETRNPIDYQSNVVLLGSCFSENVGDKFNYFKYSSQQNPFGILFHPKAIETLITHAINDKEYTEEDIFLLNERYHSFDAHSKLSTTSQEELLENLNQAIEKTNQQIKQASHIIITLGTAWVYRFIETDQIVANCHKVPQKKFLKELSSMDNISESLDAIITLIREINPKANFIFTVSPVRHLKDGFVENQQSKAHLISAIHQIAEPRKRIFYFPSYEIMMDELRDYRFYAEDMIHPNTTAIQYIWERFIENWISESALSTMKQIDSIQKRLQHKPFNSNSEAHQQFLKRLSEDIKQLEKQFPNISF